MTERAAHILNMSRYRGVLPYIIAFSIVVMCSCFFLSIDANKTIDIWDEAVYANNAMEMCKTGNILVYQVNGTVNNHNSKPPLVIWLEALSFKIFGYTETAFRLPTFLALTGVIALFFVLAKRLNNIYVGIIASLCLITCRGAIRPHVFTTGDLDGVLILVTSGIFIVHLLYLMGHVNVKKYIWTQTVLFTIGYFIKSTAVLLVLPSLAISLLAAGKMAEVARSKRLYLGMTAALVTIALYYALREHYEPGYWKVVWYSEYTRLVSDISHGCTIAKISILTTYGTALRDINL